MAGAFVPDSIHTVMPKIVQAGATSHLGRPTVSSVTSRPMLDPLFNLAPKDSKGFPMSEEEFYRMKIKLKDRSVSALALFIRG